jgi:hypothetical protein
MAVDMAEAVVAEGEVAACIEEVDTPVPIVAGTPEDIGVDTLVATVAEFLGCIGVHTLEGIGVVTFERIGVVTLEGIGVVTMVVAIVLRHIEGLMGFMAEDTMVPGVITHIGGFLDFQCLAGLT